MWKWQEIQSLLHEKVRKYAMSKNRKPPAKTSAQMRWQFDPDIPTDDFFDGRNPDELWDLQEAVDNFESMMNDDTFLTWAAVAYEVQGISIITEATNRRLSKEAE
jgi:hypothetical protein